MKRKHQAKGLARRAGQKLAREVSIPGAHVGELVKLFKLGNFTARDAADVLRCSEGGARGLLVRYGATSSKRRPARLVQRVRERGFESLHDYFMKHAGAPFAYMAEHLSCDRKAVERSYARWQLALQKEPGGRSLPEREFLSTDELSRRIKISSKTLRLLVKRDVLPNLRPSRRILRFRWCDIVALVRGESGLFRKGKLSLFAVLRSSRFTDRSSRSLVRRLEAAVDAPRAAELRERS